MTLADNRFVIVTSQENQFYWLSEVLTGLGVTIWDKGDRDSLLQLVGSVGVRIVFLEFNAASMQRSAALAEELLAVFPSLWLVGIGRLSSGDDVLMAMRAGAREFIEDFSEPAKITAVVNRLLEKAPPLPASPRGELLALLGARPGVGVSMAAVHSALLLKSEFARKDEVLLLDFGYPSADASLYLDTKLFYTFADAARSVRRFDHALMKTAFVRHKSGLAVLPLPLPQNMSEMREVTSAEIMNLITLLKSYFRYVVADLGGFANTDFLLNVLGVADRALLLCEQTVPSNHSARQTLRSLDEKGYDRKRIELVISKHDTRIGMDARQIAKLLDLKWVGNLPSRTLPLIACANEGRSLLDTNPRDEYLTELRKLVRAFVQGAAVADKAARQEPKLNLGRLTAMVPGVKDRKGAT